MHTHKKIKKSTKKKGFTLMEILLVVGAIAILAGIVVVAINPTKQLADTRNAQRKADVATILNATYQYVIDGNALSPSIITSPTEICDTSLVSPDCSDLIDLSPLKAGEEYLTDIPVEPQKTNANGAGYTIMRTAGGRITVAASISEPATDPLISGTK